ncbi:MAG TPA: exopolysaccharide biosynthesis protein [Clostridiales bacterium]|nr:MAG: hypothetical protein A2Y18_08450 [Clostridiales bacterium GWD2_32_19]HCC07897.1 exopolysaccharide biosynthesis protein [Clostridiales bacterium]
MKSKIHKSALYILGFVAFEAVFCSILAFILIFYGPFTNIKENYVTTAMATLNHQYLVTSFLSKEEINEILLKSSFDFESEREDTNNVKIKENQANDEIKLVEVNSERFKGYMLIVDNPKRISVGLSSSLGKGGITLSSIVKNYKALGGVNAGGFGDANFVGTGGKPNGIVVENGEIKYKEEGTNTFSIVGFNEDDKLIVGGNYNKADMKKYKIRDAVSFGPALIINGKTMIKKGNGGMGINPRTAIGQTQDGTVLLLVIDGRREDSIGATLKDVQNILLEYGAYNASNLDGGSSATMIYDNKLINKPSDILGERSIPSAFIIK